MIDKFQRIAQAIQILRLPLIVVGVICLASMVIIVLSPSSAAANQFLMLSFVGLVWAATTFSFIATFHTIPEKADKSLKFISRLKRRLSRGWYWFISLVFLGTTTTALILTGRLMSIWLKD